MTKTTLVLPNDKRSAEATVKIDGDTADLFKTNLLKVRGKGGSCLATGLTRPR